MKQRGGSPVLLPAVIMVIIASLFVYQEYKISGLEKRLEELSLERSLGNMPHGALGNKYLDTISPPPMPSVHTTVEEEQKVMKQRGIYGGRGDKAHLGGFTKMDTMTMSTNMWNFMISQIAIKSMIDLGCGKGNSFIR